MFLEGNVQSSATTVSKINTVYGKYLEYHCEYVDVQDDDDVPEADQDLETLLLQLQCPGCSISATAPIYQCAQVGNVRNH